MKCFILPNRPKKTASRYQRIWTDEGSPFIITAKQQKELLENELRQRGHNAVVSFGMRYGQPSLADGLKELVQAECERIVLAPLFPQEANVTTHTVIEAFEAAVGELSTEQQNGLTTSCITSYCEREDYLQALACSVQERWQWKPGSKLLFSYHSTLVADIEKGDPYYGQTVKTSQGVAKLLDIPDEDWACAYHSRFDSRKWLKPPAEEVLKQWVAQGVNDIAVIAPVFTADCIETLIDIEVEQKEFFLNEYKACHPDKPEPHFCYIPTLGARPDHIKVLANAVEANLNVT